MEHSNGLVVSSRLTTATGAREVSSIGMTADGLLDGALAESVRPEVARMLRLAGETENTIVDLLRLASCRGTSPCRRLISAT